MSKVAGFVGKIQNVISILAGVLILGFIGFFFFSTYVMKTEVISKSKFFSITSVNKYKFIENDLAKDYDLSVYDDKKGVYFLGNTWEKEGNLKEYAESTRIELENSEGSSNVSKLNDGKIGKFNSYSYSYEYVDNNNENYYALVTYIDGKDGEYVIIAECRTSEKTKYEKDLIKIVDSFKEK